MASTPPVEPPGIFPAPPGVTPNYVDPELRTDGIPALICIFVPLSFIFLVLRLYTKACIIRLFGLEDVLATLGWMFGAVYSILQWVGFGFGGGIHIWNEKMPEYAVYAKIASTQILCNVPSVSFPKMAILLFYLRLNPARNFRYCTFAVLALTTSYLVSFFLAQLFQCHPVEKFWLPFKPGKCLDLYPLYVAIPIVNVILDCLVLVLPIPMLIKLQANRRTKIILAAIFGFSSCTVIISGVRVWAVQKILGNKDLTWYAGPSNAIAVVETNMTIICSCVMVLRPFCRRHLPFLLGSGRSKPSDDNNDAVLAYDGPMGPKSKSDYRTKVSSGGSKESKRSGKRSLWSHLGGGTLKDDDDEDMESLSKELKVLAPHVGANNGGHRGQRDGGRERWQDQNNTQSLESIGAPRTEGRDQYPLSREGGDLETGIVKTVSLDVR
ncbi:MAG: hypothetical protein Q9222_004007 [Ikaeria aurantiellina]